MSYSEKYLAHFTNPRGVGEVEPPDASAEVHHEGGGCFDRVKLTVRLDGDKVAELKFRARACSGTIAACSALTEWARGRNVREAAAVTPDDLTNWLGGIPEKKQHSVELAARALSEALGTKTLA